MIAHTSVAVKDYEKSKELYARMLAPLGYSIGMDATEHKAVGFKDAKAQDFWVSQSESPVGTHVAFAAQSADEVEAFYAAALAAGAKDNGEPGYRTSYAHGYFAAFVHDLDGNNIEAVWFDPSKK